MNASTYLTFKCMLYTESVRLGGTYEAGRNDLDDDDYNDGMLGING